MVLLAVITTACSRGTVEERLAQPTAERLAIRPSAVGVPYDRFVLVRNERRLTALRIRPDAAFGARVTYEWYLADDHGRFSHDDSQRVGRGETEESPHTGRISLPGGLTVEWSRGSETSGWLYWPAQGPPMEVFSQTFADLRSIDPRRSSGRWLTRPGER